MAAPQTKKTAEIEVSDLTVLISSASRLLTALTQAEPFKKADIGFAEWLSLSTLVDKDGVSNKQVARAMGVTNQRANQICTSLAKSGLIAVEQASDDNRRNVLKVTPKGKRLNETLSAELKSLLETALKDRERSLKVASNHLRLLTRRLQPVPGKAERKQRAAGK